MPIQLNSPGWQQRPLSRGKSAAGEPNGLPAEYLTAETAVAEEVVLEPKPASRGQTASGGGIVDLSYTVEPGHVAILAIRHPSGALTFHPPVQATSRGPSSPTQARFQVTVRPSESRGLIGKAIKAIVIKVAHAVGDKAVSFLLPKLVAAFEQHSWKKRGLKEGWLRVTKETLAAQALLPGAPVSPERSLLFIHGTFSNATAAFTSLAGTDFFERVKGTYGDRMFAFNHFSLSRTPEENAAMLLQGLPEQATTFDVITHSRGGLVLRTLVERANQFEALSKRFKLGHAVLVASPNEGTPLATPERWEDTVGWLANVLEIVPDNPFTIAAEFVGHAIVWIAKHASGDVPGLHAMDRRGQVITDIQGPAGPRADAYSALVANYNPSASILQRLSDAVPDQFFGSANDLVVPSEGGWRVDRSKTLFIPSSRIGCYGPGGNLAADSVWHGAFFSRAETADFLVSALQGTRQPLHDIDPGKALPTRAFGRGEFVASTETPVVPIKDARRTAGARLRATRGGAPTPLRISITNGDLTFEPEALLLGHYDASRLSGTEEVMDRLIGGAMNRSLKLGLYARAPGTHEIFINDYKDPERGTLIPRPRAVIVVGLGNEGNLKPGQLVRSVRVAVIAWARRLSEGSKTARYFELASTLIGSGGAGVTAGQSARLVAQGVVEANELLADGDTNSKGWPRCSHLRLIELYLDRATEAWRTLRAQDEITPQLFDLDKSVKTARGSLLRPPESSYRGAEYDFIEVETRDQPNAEPTLEYTLDTKRARSEVRGKQAQNQLVRKLVETASSDQNTDQRIGRTLFNLLVPIELEADLAGAGPLQMSLDPEAAAIPWELLDVDQEREASQKPWAIRVKLLRKLKLEEFRERVVDVDADASVLVIGEPECPPDYPRLDGARTEALEVADLMKGALGDARVRRLISDNPAQPGPDAEDIVNTLFENPWRIVHVAGHGTPGTRENPGGVVLSNGTFLGPCEIESMRQVPELVFINCCHLGAGSEAQLLKTRYDRARFASGVAGALIKIGVRCVVAAGWAVDDRAAKVFASVFYRSLLAGKSFIDAVGAARDETYTFSSDVNTWAAYQCYGDRDWTFRTKTADANQTAPRPDDYQWLASSHGLLLVLERIAVQANSAYTDAKLKEHVASLQTLERRFADTWAWEGQVAEAFGRAFAEIGAMERASYWYQRAVDAPDGGASFKAAEQLGNSRSRYAWELVDKAVRHRDAMAERKRALASQAKPRATRAERVAANRALESAERGLRKAIRTARPLIDRSLRLLHELVALKPTMERESLVASAYKRRALVNRATTPRPAAAVRRDLVAMKSAYERAVRLGETEPGADLYYPASNCLAAAVAIAAAGRKAARLDRKLVAMVERQLKRKAGADADFWSVVGGIELDLYRAFTSPPTLGAKALECLKSHKGLYNRATSTRRWASVYDTACLVLGDNPGRSQKANAVIGDLLKQLRTFAHRDEDQ